MNKEKIMNLLIENLKKRNLESNTSVTIMKLRGDKGIIGEVKDTSKNKSYSFRVEFEKERLVVSQDGNSIEISLSGMQKLESFLKRFSTDGIVFKEYRRLEVVNGLYNGEIPVSIKLGGYYAVLAMENILPTVTEQMLLNVRNLLYSDPKCEHYSYATYSYLDNENKRKYGLTMTAPSVRDQWFEQLSYDYVDGKIENLRLSNGMSPLQYADREAYEKSKFEEQARKKWLDITGNHGRGR